jgi:cation diffusion facilitator CzcD-associated flavoprotein CzcO
MHEQHVDVLVVGAGLSGIGAGCRLRQRCPDKTFLILESRAAIGGTWDQFRFPGVRSDSDIFTLCYPFRPWSGARAIVDGASIRDYIRETAAEYDLERAIRFHHRVLRADWSSASGRWRVHVERADTGEQLTFSCGFLLACAGYFRYDRAYTPDLPGRERFTGEIAHPQFWSEHLDHHGKRVVVIGSGATAMTLVPALAGQAAHVTLVQRSPSYVVSVPALDPVAGLLGRVLPARLAYPIVRRKNVRLTLGLYDLSRRRPLAMRQLVRRQLERRLPAGYDIDTHFSPRYEPWDQRMCFVPDGDLFKAISDGRVSVVTDRIETLTARGLALASGAELEADLIVTATGLELVPLGGIELSVDGAAVSLPDAVAYRGMMLSGVPNLAFAFGYINQSWTLGSDLTCEHVCRLLGHMDRNGYRQCTPRRPAPASASAPFLELTSGYVLRAIDRFPRQGTGDPWRRQQNYPRDRRAVRRAPLDDPALEFSPRAPLRGRRPAATVVHAAP